MNVFLLALCQAMLFTGASLAITAAAVVGDALGAGALATLPLGVQLLATMFTTVPASLLMQRYGRRAGFFTGIGCGFAGALVSMLAIMRGDFVLFCIGAAGLGVFNGTGQFFRFTAAEVAPPERRERAISLVMAGGVAAAFLGPNLAHLSRDLLAAQYAGTYASLLGVYTVALLAVFALRLPKPQVTDLTGGRPLREIACTPGFLVAVLNAMIAYGVMTLIMTSTPLAMKGVGHAFGDAAWVIQWHLLGMFAPSFFTGHLIKALGTGRVLVLGAGLCIAAALVNYAGTGLWSFWGALLMLGMGWNFMFVSATALLTYTHSEAEKGKVQALNDFMVMGTTAAASFGSGVLLAVLGWKAVNLAVLPLLAVALAVSFVMLRRPAGRVESM